MRPTHGDVKVSTGVPTKCEWTSNRRLA